MCLSDLCVDESNAAGDTGGGGGDGGGGPGGAPTTGNDMPDPQDPTTGAGLDDGGDDDDDSLDDDGLDTANSDDDDDDDDDDGDTSDSGDDDDDDDTSPGTGPVDPGDDDDDDDDDDVFPEDPSYPNPANGCPATTVDGTTALNPTLDVCLPACNPNAANVLAACPQPATGNAPGLCAITDGTGSGETCEENGVACDTQGEFCLGAAGGDNECMNAVLCLVACPDGTTCPDGMVCTNGTCTY